MNNYKASHLSDIHSDIESNISPQNRRRAINFTSPNSMNVPLSKEHGFFTIWAIPATHDELCFIVYQKSKIPFSKEALTPWSLPRELLSNLASSFENTPPGGEDLHWNEELAKQHDKTHDINRNDILFHAAKFNKRRGLKQNGRHRRLSRFACKLFIQQIKLLIFSDFPS
jgi:hypothetical protein